MKKESAEYLVKEHSLSVRQACGLLSLSRSCYYYQMKEKHKQDDIVVKVLSRLAAAHPAYGFRKLFHMVRKEGYEWNHKRVYRIYKLLKMNLQRRARKRLPARVKTPLSIPDQPNQIWSMDFMSDALRCGRRFRTLNILDDYNREVLSIEVSTSIPAYAVVEDLKLVIEQRGRPQQIRVDNGPEFLSHTFISFCNEERIEINYIQPGKPMQNGFIERFNRSYRNEILDAYLFESVREVTELTQEWIMHYNEKRPHQALNGLTPVEYTMKQNKQKLTA